MDLGLYPPNMHELPKVQLKRLRYVTNWLHQNNEFFHKKLDASGVSVSDIQSLEDIQKLPFTTKDEVRKLPDGALEWLPEQTVRKHSSSGTTGLATSTCFTDIDLKVMGILGARSLALCGCEKGMTLQVNYGYGFFTGGLIFDEAARTLGMKILPQGGAPIVESLRAMRRFKPEAWCCTPTYAKRTVAHLLKEDDKDISWKIGSHGAEVWTDETRKFIENSFGPDYNAYDVYGLAEKGGPFVAHECEAKGGSHVWTDMLFMEVLDDNNELVSEGEIGELVLTHLYIGGYSTIRYKTGDRVKYIAETGSPCTCFADGYPKMRALGRKIKDEFKIGGEFYIRADFENVAVKILKELQPLGEEIGEFRVELSIEKGTTHVEYCIESDNPEHETIVKDVIRAVSDSTIYRRFPIRIVPKGTYTPSLGKTPLLIDKRE